MEEITEPIKKARKKYSMDDYEHYADLMLELALQETEWHVSIASMARRLGINEVLAGHLWRAKVRDKIELTLQERQ